MPEPDASQPVPLNTASFVVRARPLRLSVKVKISSGGLIAIAGLVSSCLLSTTALVWVATTPVRRRPIATRLSRR